MVQTSQLLHAELFEDMTDPPMFLTVSSSCAVCLRLEAAQNPTCTQTQQELQCLCMHTHANLPWQAEPCAFLDSVTRPFDAILCANFLERAERPKAVLQRLHRALKPGGVAVIVFAWFYDAGLFPQQSDEHVVEVSWLTCIPLWLIPCWCFPCKARVMLRLST